MIGCTLARDCGCPRSPGLLQSTWRAEGCFRADTIYLAMLFERTVKKYRGRGLTAEGGGFSPGFQGVLHCHQRWPLSPAAWCRRAKSVPSASDPIYFDIVQAGTALQLMSGAVPLVGGLAGFTGAALKAGDCFCCKLARTLAVRLTDVLPDGPIATSHDAEEKRTHNAAGVGWAADGSKFGVLTDGVSEEAVMEWLIEEVTNYEPSDRRETAGNRLGKRHLRKILTAVGQDCLQGVNDTGAKVNVLVSVVLPEADIRPAETSSASDGGLVRSPVSVPTHDGNLQNILAELESLKTDKEKHSAELEALEADKEKHYAELKALKAENKDLQGQVSIMIHRSGMMKGPIPMRP
ncbi:unnamed protein product [Ectocarpus sp. 8 AP-2014]